MKLCSITLEDYLDTLASDAPAPGGGSAAALCGAQAAALLEMVCRLTIGRPAYAASDALNREILEEAHTLRTKLTRQIDADSEAYLSVTAAFRLQKDTDAEKAVRSEAIQRAMVSAAETPLYTMQLATRASALARRLETSANPNCASDVAVAKLNLTACFSGAKQNVLINLPFIKNTAVREQLTKEMQQLEL